MMKASEIALRWRFKGRAFTITSGAASGLLALEMPMQALRDGYISYALVIAAEELSFRTVEAYADLRVLARDQDGESRPFDVDRSGIVPAEGAVALVLEPLAQARRRHAAI